MFSTFSPGRVLRTLLIVLLAAVGVLAVQDSGYARLVPGPVPELPVREDSGRWLVLTVGAEEVSRAEVFWTLVSGEELFRLVEGSADTSMAASRSAAATAASDLLGEPVAVPYQLGEVQGPSAGLTLALAGLDNHLAGALSNGRRIAATGEITAAGEVLLVGGLVEKAGGLAGGQVDLLLVPRAEAAVFRGLLPEIPVIGVETLAEAITALCPGARGALPVCS
jgi:hypothetical protein